VVDLGRTMRQLLDVRRMSELMRGCEVALHLTPPGPPGFSVAAWSPDWRLHDLTLTLGVRRLLEAARTAGVRRVVAQSASLVYADQGEDWITEGSPVCVTSATEPASEGELAVQEFAAEACHTGVILRMGQLVGDCRHTQDSLRKAARGKAVAVGEPEGYVHLIHSDDVGPAIEAALTVPSGVYNVGADPVRRGELADRLAAAGRDRGAFLGPVRRRLGGDRIEPHQRSLRVSSTSFTHASGWMPRRTALDATWFDLPPRAGALR
jgi:nucleoside-diphosphate-sugar epimerase